MKYYVKDPILSRYVHFDGVPQAVSHLESMLVKMGISRESYMQNLIDLGYGYDDPEGATFVRSLSEKYDIGVIRDGKYVKTDIHNTVSFDKPEFGH